MAGWPAPLVVVAGDVVCCPGPKGPLYGVSRVDGSVSWKIERPWAFARRWVRRKNPRQEDHWVIGRAEDRRGVVLGGVTTTLKDGKPGYPVFLSAWYPDDDRAVDGRSSLLVVDPRWTGGPNSHPLATIDLPARALGSRAMPIEGAALFQLVHGGLARCSWPQERMPGASLYSNEDWDGAHGLPRIDWMHVRGVETAVPPSMTIGLSGPSVAADEEFVVHLPVGYYAPRPYSDDWRIPIVRTRIEDGSDARMELIVPVRWSKSNEPAKAPPLESRSPGYLLAVKSLGISDGRIEMLLETSRGQLVFVAWPIEGK